MSALSIKTDGPPIRGEVTATVANRQATAPKGITTTMPATTLEEKDVEATKTVAGGVVTPTRTVSSLRKRRRDASTIRILLYCIIKMG